jgi:hypothetical protein
MAIRRHCLLVCCAFSFCWWIADYSEDFEFASSLHPAMEMELSRKKSSPLNPPVMADGTPSGPSLVGALYHAAAILASVVNQAPTSSIAGST